MITSGTAAALLECHREIGIGETIFNERLVKQSFRREKELQLVIPIGRKGYKTFKISPSTAKAVLMAHIADKRAELLKLNETAMLEAQNEE